MIDKIDENKKKIPKIDNIDHKNLDKIVEFDNFMEYKFISQLQ
jgi:hypothetical protein